MTSGNPARPLHSIDRTPRREVAQPVLFSVLIILLVYVPVVLLGGVEGKMFADGADGGGARCLTSLLLAPSVCSCRVRMALRPQDLIEERPPLLIPDCTVATVRCWRARSGIRWGVGLLALLLWDRV